MRNTMKKADYLKEHIWGSIIIFWGFQEIFYRCIPGFNYTESMFVLVVIGICIMGIGISIDWECNRTYTNVVQNILCAYGVFVSIAYMDIYQNRIIFLGMIGIFGSLIMTAAILKRSKKRDNVRRKNMIVNIWRRIFTCTFSALLIPLVVSVFANGTFLNLKMKSEIAYKNEINLEESIKDIANVKGKCLEKQMETRNKL